MSRVYLQKLHSRLSLSLFIVFVIVGCAAAVLFVRSSQAYHQQVTQLMHKDLAAHVAGNYLLFENGSPNLESAEHTFHELMILGPNFEFYVLGKDGEILACSTDPANIKRNKVSLVPVNKFISGAPLDNPLRGEDPRSDIREKVFSASAIYNNGVLDGYLYVILGSEIYDDIAGMVAQSKTMQWGLLLFSVGLVFTFIATLWLTGFITSPLRKLTKQVQQVPLGQRASNAAELFQHWQPNSQNEIHSLGSAFKQLLENLQEQYDKVLTVDQLRKELLSHVSHDLRTPLASLLGYLETWEMQYGEQADEKSSVYIATAKKSAHKISNLVEQLFELAHLDSGDVQVNIEEFAIAELVQDVLQKFQISADQKSITLSVYPKDSGLRVVGDIEKLERVFTNLIDNALRHTEQGGTITVRLAKNGHAVAIEVADNGIGIPADDLPHVFDPHFKACNSVRGNTANGGLGLAITKKLLDLHRTSIKVSSAVNSGTSFLFELSTT
ncbi:sensor histidine kinase [Teredinibacter waterburyi]|jgi:Signal transduction histidine kinase|uniref:sensor histidine kinase n=1 Tax=Teredinibacter waterburyi TaxID=1500538 RepID=UPI0016600637|nr:HAMP domain-containing sensor histidine kinase [Teredinibacter waterburyi]